MITNVSPREEKYLKEGKCPDCGCEEFIAGPCGGGAQNFYCFNCKAGFNISWPFSPQRINAPNITPQLAENLLQRDLEKLEFLQDLYKLKKKHSPTLRTKISLMWQRAKYRFRDDEIFRDQI